MAKKKPKSFYEYMLSYPFKGDRCRLALADEFRRLSKRYPQLEEINSMTDLMLASSLLTDRRAIEAASPELWCEYCITTGRPIS